MTIRSAPLLSFILLVIPAFSDDGPKPSDSQPEFFFTRLAYTDIWGRGPAGNEATSDLFRRFPDGPNGFRFFFGRASGAWMTDSWDADYKYMWGIQRLTNVRLYMEPHPLPIMSSDLFQFPYIYGVEVGQMELSDEDAQRLREYLLRGGFWHCDDFWGLRQLAQFRRQMFKVFPDRPLQELPMTHEIFHAFFDINKVIQVPNVRNGEIWKLSGGRTPTWEQPDDTQPRVFGISDDAGRLMVLVTYNSDLGDAWEWMDDPNYPAEFTGYAYRFGMNSIIYAMTH
jgi:Domain of unknown function (DUF4159)